MMHYIESPSNDPHFNLALEQYVFDRMDREDEYFMLWQNDNAVIVGKHQNTAGEINPTFVKEHGVGVVRRLSGGGAVYHDMGNINFTFIVSSAAGAGLDFATFCQPIVKALAQVGVQAQINGRNDMTIDGKKFSGNSQYSRRGRTMHHGTIMFDSNLEVVGQALAVSRDKLESKGIQSVRSRVTNVKPHVPGELSTEEFFGILRSFMFEEYHLQPRGLTPEDLGEIQAIQAQRYDQWSWNYGTSPAYELRKERRVEGCGKIEVFLQVQKGVVADAAFYGDYFGNGDTQELVRRLVGCSMEAAALRKALAGVDIGHYFNHMDMETFLSVLTQ